MKRDDAADRAEMEQKKKPNERMKCWENLFLEFIFNVHWVTMPYDTLTRPSTEKV